MSAMTSHGRKATMLFGNCLRLRSCLFQESPRSGTCCWKGDRQTG